VSRLPVSGYNEGMKLLTLFAAVLLALTACGGSEDENSGATTGSGAGTPFTADDVEEAFESELATGGERVVELGNEPPESIECEKSGKAGEWSCRVTPGKGGRTMLCIVVTDPANRTVTRRSCAPVDY
jgi:hypothetical protein